MASWMCLPALLIWAWLAGGIQATSSCNPCEENGSGLVCRQSEIQEEFQMELSPEQDTLQLRCEPTTSSLNFSFIENCTFPSVETVEIYGCPLPNISFGDMLLSMGVYPENVTAFGFYSRNDRDGQLENWHLDGLVSLLTLEFVDNDFLGLPEDLFFPTPNLKSVRVVLDSFSTLPDLLFSNTLNLESMNFENNRLENVPSGLLSNLSSLLNVSFSHNYISGIEAELFRDNINLENLNLSHNQISSLERDVFRDLKLLKNLSLQGNLLSSLPDGIFIDLLSLESLDLNSNVLKLLPKKVFDRLTKVTKIDLSNNSLEELPEEVFMECESLERLSLRHNKLQILKTTMFPMPDTSLTFLDLGHNNISFSTKLSKIIQPQFVSHEDNFPLSRQMELREVLLNDNRIESIPHAFNRLFVDLVKIDLSGNEIEYVSFHELHFLQDSISLDLSNNKIKLMDFHDLYPVPPEKEVKMFLAGNDLLCDCRLFRFTRIVKGEPLELENISIMKIELEDIDKLTCKDHESNPKILQEVDTKSLICFIPEDRCIKNCHCVWRAYDFMFIINCSYQGLRELPDLSGLPNISVTLNMKNNSLHNLKGLQDPQYSRIVNLTVSNNEISHINESDIPETLKILDVRGNNLTSLPVPLLEYFNTTDMTLSFGRNPWKCDCELIDFLNFLHTPLRKVTDFDDITCSGGTDYLRDLTEYSLCPFFMQPMVIVTLVAIGAFLLLFAVLGTVSFYKYKQGIKVWLYAHRMCLWAITEEEFDADKKFDAFISYSHKDEEFVNSVLVPGLESGNPKYRICLHYRDWVPGEYIQNQILQSVEASRRTVVILSSNFIESVWGQLEFKAAHAQALQDRISRIIVIVYGEIPPESELDEKLKLYIATKTYVKWGDAKFWEKLRYFMPHPPKKLNT